MPHLHALIHRLSKQEKRYLKLFAGRQQKGESNYMRLFDLIHAQPNYDEAAIRNEPAIQQEKWVRNYGTTKYELYQLILRGLHAYHYRADKNFSLEVMIHQARILLNKRLYEQSARLLAKAEKLCREGDRYRILLAVLELRIKLIQQTMKPVAKESEMELVSEEELRVLHILQLEAQMKRYFAEMQSMTLWKSAEQLVQRSQRSQELLDHELQTLSQNLSFKALLYHYDVRSSCLHNLKRYAEAIAEVKLMVQAMEEKPVLLSVHLPDYVRALTKLMLYKSDQADYEGYRLLLEKLWATLESARQELPDDMHMQVFMRANVAEMLYRNHEHEFTGMAAFAERFESGLATYGDSIPTAFRGVLLCQVSWLLLCAGLPQMALKMGNLMWMNKEKMGLPSFESQSKVLQLLTHFDLGNEDLLPYLARSLYRTIRRATQKSPLDEIIIAFFRRKLNLVKNREEMRIALTELLEEIEAQSDHPLVKGRLIFMDYRIWVRQKLARE